MAGNGTKPDSLRRDDQAGLPLRHELVALHRPQAIAEDAPATDYSWRWRLVMNLRSTVRPAGLLDRNLYRGSLDSAVDAVITAAKEEQGGYACFCNVHLWTVGRRSTHARQALDEARLVFPDGRPIAWLYSSGEE